MPISEQLTTAIREINTRRREQEQTLQRGISERSREADEAEASLPQLDRELAERLRKVQEEFERRKAEQRKKVEEARAEAEHMRRGQDSVKVQAEEQLWAAARDSAGKVARELREREQFVRRSDEELKQREQVLAAHPDLAKTLEEYEQNRRFLETLGGASLPGETLTALKTVLESQVGTRRDALRRRGIALDAIQPPDPDEILLLYDTGELLPGLSGISVLTPCPFEEYETPNLARPDLPLRVAGVVVRAVAMTLSALGADTAPILYRDADGFLAVTGICGEGVNIADLRDIFEVAVQEGTPAIADAERANLRLVMFALPPGLLGKFVAEEES
jgi:hypothetical protein